MSEGPIFHERRATTVPPVSIPDSKRLCMRRLGTLVAECGRKKTTFAERDEVVTCPECQAAVRADAQERGAP